MGGEGGRQHTTVPTVKATQVEIPGAVSWKLSGPINLGWPEDHKSGNPDRPIRKQWMPDASLSQMIHAISQLGHMPGVPHESSGLFPRIF